MVDEIEQAIKNAVKALDSVSQGNQRRAILNNQIVILKALKALILSNGL